MSQRTISTGYKDESKIVLSTTIIIIAVCKLWFPTLSQIVTVQWNIEYFLNIENYTNIDQY